MDLVKFISLLSRESLYFSCPSEFHDPYEGFIPRAWLLPLAKNSEVIINGIENLKDEISDTPVFEGLSKDLDDVIINCNNSIADKINRLNSKFGVSCWHKSDYESEAMWKLYSNSGQGIAIESTIGQLKASIASEESLEVVHVRYLAEDNPGDYDETMNTLAWKRKSFEHEKELRAIVTLNEKGKGKLVKCDLEKLINQIHIHPEALPHFKEVIQYACSWNQNLGIDKPIIQSTLLHKPDYSIKALVSTA